ncbi:IS630 transposase-related protein [Piscirickettsia salmonis]|uniref:IS630 transposase-related protein n=2 Tax=Piscirickettsia salmonis TaxID=1238 RepID=UPI00094B2E49|nr:IS630 transposase-related protein [Piscirickettsia salmonis]
MNMNSLLSVALQMTEGDDVKNYPDSYQWERAQRFGVSQHCIQHWLNFLAISCKKNTKTPKSQRKYTYKLPE